MCVHVCVCTGVCACMLCVLWVTCVCVHMCKRGSEGRTAKMLPQEREDGVESGWCQDLKCIMYHVHVWGPEMYHAGSPPGQGSGLLLVFISAPNMANVNIC